MVSAINTIDSILLFHRRHDTHPLSPAWLRMHFFCSLATLGSVYRGSVVAEIDAQSVLPLWSEPELFHVL